MVKIKNKKKKINIYLEFKNKMAYGAEYKLYLFISCKITLYIIYRFIKQLTYIMLS